MIPKVKKWIQNGKYKCLEKLDEVTEEEVMKITMNFMSFTLKKVEKSDPEKIAEQKKCLDDMISNLKKESALFNFVFFNNQNSQKEARAPAGGAMFGMNQFNWM